MATSPVRVSEAVHGEVQAAARLLGCNAAELLQRAWDAYRESPEFRSDFEYAQKAFAAGDLDSLATQLHDEATARAQRSAAKVQAMRKES